MALIDLLRARAAARSEGRSAYAVSKMRHRPTSSTVSDSPDLQRILSLPRRKNVTDVTILGQLVSAFTQRLRTPTRTMTLLPVQALALSEAESIGGLFGNIGVGRGKTLLSLLLPVVMRSARTVLLIPPGLVEQLLQKNYLELQRHWLLPEIGLLGDDKMITVVKHSQASSQVDREFLEQVKPDLIVIDEAHAFANDSARGHRLVRYVAANPSTRCCVMSGTLIDAGMSGASRLANLSLRLGSPYPRSRHTLLEWSEVLEETAPRSPGAMMQLAEPGENVRSAVRRRVLETPGVVVAPGVADVNASLLIKAHIPKVPKTVKAALTKLRQEWETPAGVELIDSLEVARHEIELSQGCCYRWDWPAGVKDLEWLAARSGWGKAVRKRLLKPQPGLDTEGLLRKAAANGSWQTPAYEPWAAVMRRPQPPTVSDWVDTFLVDDAVAWGKKAPGIIWYEHTAVGPAIAAAGDFPLYDGGPACARDIINESGKRSIVASRNSHGTGLELQMFHRNYVCCPVPSARAWEQLLGRTHRVGQSAPVVEVHVCLHTPELVRCFEEAQREAKLLRETAPGNEHQKILFADVLWSPS
jgi:hypothetical protein